jgi:NADH-quinone oxidoreductase subunit M
MTGLPMLSIMILLPLAAAAACLLQNANGARWTALGVTLALLGMGIALWVGYDIGGQQWQFVEKAPLFGRFGWNLGIDGIALMLIVLSVFLMPICVLASWESIEKRVPEYMAAFLLMEALMIGVFAAQDLFLFYIFFEAGLIPMYLIIGIWGGAERIYASYKFFLYTLFGSVLMLIAMLWMARTAGTTDIPTLMEYFLPHSPSKCRCGPCTHGCPMRTSRHQRQARLFWRAYCLKWVVTALSVFRCQCFQRRRRSWFGWCLGFPWLRSFTRRSSPWCRAT